MFVVSFALSILYYFAAKSNDRTQQFLRGNVSILPKRKGRFGPRERAPAAPLRAMPAERLFFRRGSAIMNVRRGVPRARCRRTPCGGETDSRAARVPKNMDINKYDPKFKLRRRDLLGLTDLTSEEIFELLYAAKAMKKKFRVRENSTLLRGKTVALLFGNASTRTRVSFEMGIRQMSGDYIYLSKDETQLSRGESLKDTAAMLGRYGLSAVVLRSLTEAQTHEFASYSDIPVINGITEGFAPAADPLRPVHHLGSKGPAGQPQARLHRRRQQHCQLADHGLLEGEYGRGDRQPARLQPGALGRRTGRCSTATCS